MIIKDIGHFRKNTNTFLNDENKTQFVSAPKNNTNITFKGDTFDRKTDIADIEKVLRKIQDDFRVIREKYLNPPKYNSNDIAINNAEFLNKEIKFINEQYKLVQESLSSPNPVDAKSLQALGNFIKKMNNLDDNKGFGRIAGSGYADIVDELKNKFALQIMGKSIISDNVEVPDVVLFYGPPGTGKSTFAQALAEQSLSFIERVDANELSSKEAFEEIKQKAVIAKNNYLNSNANKTRTIILVNEAEAISYKGSPIVNEFKKFASECANKYKCTLFFTTNNPLDFDPELLSNKITPIKVALMPADRKTCNEIVDFLLKQRKEPIKNVDKIVNAFFTNPQYLYSNKNMVDSIDQTLREKVNPGVNDYIKIITESIIPSIPKKLLASYPKNNQELMQMLSKYR
jgi:SpoVK/Ycf46/Vps4 family AAA+-type ATPase